MGFRNHLHVCQHCGIVHATSSATGPKKCVVCDAFTFSEYDATDRAREGREAGSSGERGELTERVTPIIRS